AAALCRSGDAGAGSFAAAVHHQCSTAGTRDHPAGDDPATGASRRPRLDPASGGLAPRGGAVTGSEYAQGRARTQNARRPASAQAEWLSEDPRSSQWVLIEELDRHVIRTGLQMFAECGRDISRLPMRHESVDQGIAATISQVVITEAEPMQIGSIVPH